MAGALEVHASALKDSLIDGMSFGSRPTASYIINRRSVSFPPQSGGTFKPGILRLIRFSIQDATDGGSSGWLDGETLRLAFTFHNKSDKSTTFFPNLPASMFRRIRVLVAGVEVHDIQDYGRVVQMFSNLLPWDRQANNAAEGFGSSTTYSEDHLERMGSFSQPIRPIAVPAGESRRVLTPFLAPFFSAQKLLPLALCGGIVVEMELDE